MMLRKFVGLSLVAAPFVVAFVVCALKLGIGSTCLIFGGVLLAAIMIISGIFII